MSEGYERERVYSKWYEMSVLWHKSATICFQLSARASIEQEEVQNDSKMQQPKGTCEVSEVFVIFQPFHLSICA